MVKSAKKRFTLSMPQKNRRIEIDEKLTVLQETDRLRKWDTLEDRRVCVLCDKVITGGMIDVWQDQEGGFHLHCPTRGCPAGPRDWFYHGATRPSEVRVARSRAPILPFRSPSLPARRVRRSV